MVFLLLKIFNEIQDVITKPLLELDNACSNISFFDAFANMKNATCTVQFLRYILVNYRGPFGGVKCVACRFSTKKVLTQHQITVLLAILPYLEIENEEYLSKSVFMPVRQLMSCEWNNMRYWTPNILLFVKTFYTLKYCAGSPLVLLPNELLNHILQFVTILGLL